MKKFFYKLTAVEWLAVVLSFLFVIGIVSLFNTGEKKLTKESDNRLFAEQVGLLNSTSCNVAHLPIRGIITTYSNDAFLGEMAFLPQTSSWSLIRKIDQAENDPTISAILLEVDSLGGLPYASEEILQALDRTTKPVVALIRAYGVSGAYYLSLGADHIIAGQNSEVGSIGIIASYLEETKKNEDEGISYVRLVTGEYKDLGSPYQKLSGDGRNLIEDQLNYALNIFVDEVSRRRLIEREEVVKLADGRTFFGQQALDLGLVDQVGGMNEAFDWLSGQSDEKSILCPNYGIDLWSLTE